MGCGSVFTTHETIEYGSNVVVRHNEGLTPFSRDKLFASLYECCKHRVKAVDDASALVQTIIGQLRAHIAEGVLERDVIATVAAATLERYDVAAATMYSAYHPASRK
jgi:transcriptional regulator NrdR family protein